MPGGAVLVGRICGNPEPTTFLPQPRGDAIWLAADKASARKIAEELPKMTKTAVDKASANLAEWAASDEWAPRLWEVHMDHMESIAESVEGDPYELLELLGDSAAMLNAFVAEDFFGKRFGEHEELNVIDEYLEQRGRSESVEGRRYLEAMRDSTPSLYEVVEVDPGRCLKVKDLLVPGEAVTVFEKLGSQSAALWDRLAARIVVVDGERLFTGAVLHFRHEAADHVLWAIDELVKKLKSELRKELRRAGGSPRTRRRRARTVPPIPREEIIRMLPCAEILSHFWLIDALARVQAPLPELRNTDDEPLILCEVRFPITGDEAEISSVLDGIEEFERVEDGGAHWVWSAPGSPTHRLSQGRRGNPVAEPAQDLGSTTLGHAEIGSDAVTLSVNSRERAERGQALLSSQLGHLVGQAEVSTQDLYQLLKAGAERPTRDDIEPPSEEELKAIHAYQDDHYRRTLDDPLPVLGGRTLRQAAKTKKGREEVIDWLKQLENIEHRKATQQGQRVYDTRWIWHELGIERAP